MTRVSLPPRGVEVLFGTQDENLRFLEQTLAVRILNEGNDLLVQGEEKGVAVVASVFDGIISGLVIGAIFAWRWQHT